MALLPIWGWLELTLLQGVEGGPQGTAKQKSRSASRHAAGAGRPSWPMVLLFWREGPKPYSLLWMQGTLWPWVSLIRTPNWHSRKTVSFVNCKAMETCCGGKPTLL